MRKSDEVKALRDGSRGEPITHRAISFVEANIFVQERDASRLVPRLGEFSQDAPAESAMFRPVKFAKTRATHEDGTR